jgi:hypothetical protein
MDVQAAEVIATVRGTVMKGTTSELMYLDTSSGKMEVKIDSGTDTSGCKFLLPGKVISVSLSHGSDGYLHAVKMTADAQDSSVTLDTSSVSTVTGTLSDKTKNDVLCLDTQYGLMELKYDNSLDMSGCTIMVLGQNYTVKCARGSDAYMHAISISDASSSSKGGTSSYIPNNCSSSSSVTGKVSSDTTPDILYLSTSDGVMQFKIDSDADTSRGMVHTKDNKLTVYFYHGSDGYLHATGIVGEKDNSSDVTIDSSSTSTVSGQVMKKSTENILRLDTRYGEMELKMDKVEGGNNGRALVKDMWVTVTCARGSDAYMHALSISTLR